MKDLENKYEKKSRQTFNKKASTYDNGYIGKFTQKYKDLLIETIDETKSDVHGCRVLDVACGTGALLEMLHDRYAVTGYGIDISENMIAIAKEKNKDLHFEVGSASDLHFVDDNSMDIVTVSAAYHHFPDTDQFLREAYRVLKPCGAIYIAEPHSPILLRPLAFILVHFSKSGDKTFYTPKKINKSFRKNGFTPQPVKIQNHIQICYAIKPV